MKPKGTAKMFAVVWSNSILLSETSNEFQIATGPGDQVDSTVHKIRRFISI